MGKYPGHEQSLHAQQETAEMRGTLCCRLVGSSLPETSNSMMNSMLAAMRSGISAVGRRMGVGLPHTLRKLLEGAAPATPCLLSDAAV